MDLVLDEVRLQGHGAGGVQALAVRGLVEHRLDRVRGAGRSRRLVVGAVIVVNPVVEIARGFENVAFVNHAEEIQFANERHRQKERVLI